MNSGIERTHMLRFVFVPSSVHHACANKTPSDHLAFFIEGFWETRFVIFDEMLGKIEDVIADTVSCLSDSSADDVCFYTQDISDLYIG